jgi:LCP family protein required for cell wall assembly
VLAAGAFYTALVVATQIDQIFFPGNEIQLGKAFRNVPLIDKSNTDSIGGGRINVLVLGIDQRPTEVGLPSRTDTMFVMSVDPATKTSRGLAMPRDLYVDIPLSGGRKAQDRINAAYVIGEHNSPGSGIKTVEETVENLLNIKIHHHVIIDFEGFRQIIDVLGGIDLDVPPELAVNDPYYSETELRGDYYPCIFPAGIHHMDGSQALCYSRTRANDSDLERILRQQLVMLAAVDKAKQLNFISPENLVSLWKRYKNTVQTDINDQQVAGFARLAAAIDASQMSFLTLAPATSPDFVGGAAVLRLDPEGAKQIIEAFTADDQLNKEAAVVEIQNGTAVEGKAGDAMDYFGTLGLPRASMIAVNAASPTYVKTEIIDYTGKSYTANLLASWIGVPKDTIRRATEADATIRNTPTADIVVILGTDAKIDSAMATP